MTFLVYVGAFEVERVVIELLRLTAPAGLWCRMSAGKSPVGPAPASCSGTRAGDGGVSEPLDPLSAIPERETSPGLMVRQLPLGLPRGCLAFNLTYLMGDWLH